MRFQKPVVDFRVLCESGSNGFSEMVSQIATAVTTFLFNIMMMKLLGSTLIRIFSPVGTPVYEITRQGFLIFPISFLFCGFNIFASATFTALSNGKLSAIISTLRTFAFTSVALLILPQFFDVVGVWIAVPLAEFITLFVSLTFILKNKTVYHYL